MRSLVRLAAAGGLVALVACGNKTPAATGAGGGASSSGAGGGASATSGSSTSSGATTASASGSGATTASSASASGSGGGSGGATTASASGSGGATTTSASSSSGSGTCTGTQTLCATGCTDLTTGTHDCGACGHDCLGAACSAGQCAPTDVLVAQHISLIAVDPTNLFYTSDPDLDVVPLPGGTSKKLNMPLGFDALAAGAFAIDVNQVYWTSAGSPDTGYVLSVSKAGGNQTVLVNNLANFGKPNALAPQLVGGAAIAIIWVTAGDGMSTTSPVIVKTTLGGTSTALALAPVKFLNSIALDATSAYVLSPDGGNVFKVPLAGGAPVVFTGGLTNPSHVVADAQNLYVTDLGVGQSGSFPAGAIIEIPLAGGPAVTLATGIPNLGEVAVGGSHVYVTSQYQTTFGIADGAVLAVPIAGGAPVTIASDQPYPGGIAVDGTYVYWANYGLGTSDGRVRKAPR